MDFLGRLHPASQALLAGLFTWALTALGALCVVIVKRLSRRLLDAVLAFAAGVMIAVSYWSLLGPAVEMAREAGVLEWVPAVVGFLSGAAFLWAMDKVLPHLHRGLPLERAEGIKTRWQKTVLLVLAITLHNIPEGLAVGIAFGAAAAGLSLASLSSAVALTIGIGIQNFPEGFAVAMPLRAEGMTRLKSFWYGQLSALVEPLAAVIGATVTFLMRPVLPYALAFAAGAMMFVVVEELIPESQREGNADLATISAMVGFTAMMVLDIAI